MFEIEIRLFDENGNLINPVGRHIFTAHEFIINILGGEDEDAHELLFADGKRHVDEDGHPYLKIRVQDVGEFLNDDMSVIHPLD